MVRESANTLGIHRLYLPPYSPNLNRIERLWGFAKRQSVYGKDHATFVAIKKGSASPPGPAKPLPERVTKVAGPGRYVYPAISIGFVSDNTVAGDKQAIQQQIPNRPVFDNIKSWQELTDLLNGGFNATFDAIILSGHGAGGGVQTQAHKGLLTAYKITDEQATIIKNHLRPNGVFIIAGCQCGNTANFTINLELAERIGHPVICNMGDTSDGNNGSGDWLRFDPKE